MANNRNAVSADEVFAASCYVAIAVFFGIWLVWEVSYVRMATYELTTDYWGYAAALNEWLANFAAPGNPHLLDNSSSPLYTPWFWLLTSYGVYFGVDAIGLMSVAAAVSYILICTGLFVFFRSYFRHPWAPLIGFIVGFMFWGSGLHWDNLLQLRSFFFTAGYPSAIVFGLGLISFWLVLKALRGDYSSIVVALALLLLTPVMILTHLVTGIFVLATCLLLMFTEGNRGAGKRILIVVTLLLGLAVAAMWPYFSVWQLLQAMLATGPERWLEAEQSVGSMQRFNAATWQLLLKYPAILLTIMGPTVLGVGVWLWLLVRREQLFVVLGPIMLAVPLLLGVFVAIPFAYQFIIFACYFFQLALISVVLQLLDLSRMIPPPRAARAALAGMVLLMIAMVIFNVGILAVEYQGKRLLTDPVKLVSKTGKVPAGVSVTELFAELTQPVGADSVVLATALAGWPLPAFNGKVVALYQDNPLVRNQAERYAATTAFFYRDIDEQQRTHIVRKYAAEFVMLDSADKGMNAGVSGWLAAHTRLVSSAGTFAMYNILVDSLGEVPPEPEQVPDVVDPSAPAAQNIVAPVVRVRPAITAETTTTTTTSPTPRPSIAAPAKESVVKPDADAAEPAPKSFGPPIAEPMLDPAKHGG